MIKKRIILAMLFTLYIAMHLGANQLNFNKRTKDETTSFEYIFTDGNKIQRNVSFQLPQSKIEKSYHMIPSLQILRKQFGEKNIDSANSLAQSYLTVLDKNYADYVRTLKDASQQVPADSGFAINLNCPAE